MSVTLIYQGAQASEHEGRMRSECCEASDARSAGGRLKTFHAYDSQERQTQGSQPCLAKNPNHRYGSCPDQVRTWPRLEHTRIAPCTSTIRGTEASRCDRSPIEPSWPDFELAPSRQMRPTRLTKHEKCVSCPRSLTLERMIGMSWREPGKVVGLGSDTLLVHS
jgi:hypothetical protein